MIDFESLRKRCDNDATLAVFLVRDAQEVKDAGLDDLAWALTTNYCTRNDALGFFDLLEKSMKEQAQK
jgi:hypothetical protein